MQLWWATVDEIPTDVLESHARRLPANERERAARFVSEVDRRIALLTRVIVRRALQEQAQVPFTEWRFRRTPQGRPVVANAGLEETIFSVSHSRSLVVCATSAGGELGVDIEPLSGRAPLDVAERYFAPAEVADLRRLGRVQRVRRFFEYWTLKEAYLKATGVGLSRPMDSFCFRLAHGDVALEDAELMTQDHGSQWRFHVGEVYPHHCLAVALRAPDSCELQLSFSAAAPLLRQL